MSHFTVIVPAKDEAELSDRLVPYKQTGWGAEDPPELKKYLEFSVEIRREDFTEEAKKILKYYDNRIEKMRYFVENGLKVYDDDGEEAFRKIATRFLLPQKDENGEHRRQRVIQSIEMEKEELKKCIVDATAAIALINSEDEDNIRKAIMEHHGYTADDDGNLGYWHNPNDKWDWYSVGGRWTGLFMLKPGRNGRSGRPGVLNAPNTDPNRADVVLAGDVDWEAMRAETVASEQANWQSAEEVFGKRKMNKLVKLRLQYKELSREWDQNRDNDDVRKTIQSKMDAISKSLKTIYKSMPTLKEDDKDFERKSRAQIDARFFEPNGKTIEEHTKFEMDNYAVTWAFIDLDGNWHEKGEMLYFGASQNEDPDSYGKRFWKFIESLPDDQRIFLVDCHI